MLKGHHWDQGTITKQPTCTEQGEKTYKCTDEDCNETYTESIPATGHKNTRVINQKDATCESEGYTGDTYCITCNKKLKDGQTIPKTNHNWTIKETPATCESDGSRTYTCDTCQTTKTESIKATGHTYGAWITTQAATVFNPEQQKRTCSKCHKEETRTNGSKLIPTIRTNAASLKA